MMGGAQEGIRTPTPVREADFKSAASSIPPPGPEGAFASAWPPASDAGEPLEEKRCEHQRDYGHELYENVQGRA